jgi:hypothetical protein
MKRSISTHLGTVDSALSPPSGAVRLGAWLSTLLFAALMTLSGVLYLVGPKPVMNSLRQLGYPVYFLKLLGSAKLLGVLGLLLPKRPTLREWAYAGFTFDLVAAIASHLLTGGASHVPPAAFTLCILMTSYFLRRRVTDGDS